MLLARQFDDLRKGRGGKKRVEKLIEKRRKKSVAADRKWLPEERFSHDDNPSHAMAPRPRMARFDGRGGGGGGGDGDSEQKAGGYKYGKGKGGKGTREGKGKRSNESQKSERNSADRSQEIGDRAKRQRV